jgi:crossover junction endodeoxyribonuclease RuvC
VSRVRVLGIDPGTRFLGWGVVEREGMRLTHVAHGVIVTDQKTPICERLVTIERELEVVVREHKPFAASVESLFFGLDAQAAAKLGHARGVALLVCSRAGLGVAEYPPARVKRTVAGSGRADKKQVAQMMRVMLKLAELPPSDAADALALAVTHLHRAQFAAAQASASKQTPRKPPLAPISRTRAVPQPSKPHAWPLWPDAPDAPDARAARSDQHASSALHSAESPLARISVGSAPRKKAIQ